MAWDCLSVLMVLAPHGPVGTPDWLGLLGLKWAARLDSVLTGLNPGPGLGLGTATRHLPIGAAFLGLPRLGPCHYTCQDRLLP
jgi:hypothetical protein